MSKPKGDSPQAALEDLVAQIAQEIEAARGQVRQAVNRAMVQSYWQIGRLIVEHEQRGESRAAYGKQQLKTLSEQLTGRLGKGFDVGNLRNMRQFFLVFPIHDAVRSELSWTHYRRLMRIESADAREWYVNEAVKCNWSARAMERQIGALYYERLLASQEKTAVEDEANNLTGPLAETAKDYLRDPYILDFLNLQDKTYQEADLEQAIISNLQQFLLELGKGFAFVERQQCIRFDDEDFYLDLVNAKWLAICFGRMNLNQYSESSAQPGLSAEKLRVLQMMTPAFGEQSAIAVLLTDMDREIQTLQHRLAKAHQIKQGMMQQLLTGKIRLIKPFVKESENV